MRRFTTGVRTHIWPVLVGTLLTGVIGAAQSIEVGFRGPFYPPATGGNARPTGEKPESKLWWNDGFWWGILWSTAGNAYHIHRLDPVTHSWVDTATVVDDRAASRADVGWDGEHLYVASHLFSEIGEAAPAGERGELYRFSYDAVTRTYRPDLGFPVEVTRGKSEALVLEKDSTSQLWVTYVENGKVMVNHSINGNDSTWAEPFALPVAGAEQVSEDDVSSIASFNGHIGVMWSDQELPDETGIVTARMHFAVHKDGDHPLAWVADAVYTPSGDDHISLRALHSDVDGNVFAAVKTDKDAKIVMLLACKSVLTACSKKSDWSHFDVYREKEVDPTRPMVLIDEEHRELYVFAVMEEDDHRAIHYKKTSIDDIKFPKGLGVPFIRSATDLEINDPTSTKQNLNSTTGLVVLASDENTTHYFHNYLDLKTP